MQYAQFLLLIQVTLEYSLGRQARTTHVHTSGEPKQARTESSAYFVDASNKVRQ